MKKTLTALIAAMLMTTAAHALDKRGDINGKYSYENLEVKDTRNGKCRISGTIVNHSDQIASGVYITFYAFDNFDQLQWNHIVWVKAIDKGGKYPFNETILHCTEDNPYRFDFKVTE
ncbi:MAG: FxLYD domain-containing protein [Desulfococcaceae bacterium]|jgi:hypothetical protein|nr:FxLYD domain-containing protein [Desulfococcaceae bacterium]